MAAGADMPVRGRVCAPLFTERVGVAAAIAAGAARKYKYAYCRYGNKRR